MLSLKNSRVSIRREGAKGDRPHIQTAHAHGRIDLILLRGLCQGDHLVERELVKIPWSLRVYELEKELQSRRILLQSHYFVMRWHFGARENRRVSGKVGAVNFENHGIT
jgi:hypothetical protein